MTSDSLKLDSWTSRISISWLHHRRERNKKFVRAYEKLHSAWRFPQPDPINCQPIFHHRLTLEKKRSEVIWSYGRDQWWRWRRQVQVEVMTMLPWIPDGFDWLQFRISTLIWHVAEIKSWYLDLLISTVFYNMKQGSVPRLALLEFPFCFPAAFPKHSFTRARASHQYSEYWISSLHLKIVFPHRQ